MKILYILAVFSFLALAWAALAIARHVRKGAARSANPAPDIELAEAIDLRLHDLARPARDHRPPTQQDFSYFNKEAPPSPLASPPNHSEPAAKDRT